MEGRTTIAEQGIISLTAEVDYDDIKERREDLDPSGVYPGSKNPKAHNICDAELMFGYRKYQDGETEKGFTSFSGLPMPKTESDVEAYADEYYLIGVVKANAENDGIQSNNVAVHKAGTQTLTYNGVSPAYAGDLLMWTLYSEENYARGRDGKILGLMEVYNPELPEYTQQNIYDAIGVPEKTDKRVKTVEEALKTAIGVIGNGAKTAKDLLAPTGKDGWFTQLYGAMIGYHHNRERRIFAKVLTPCAERGDQIDVILR